MGGSGLHDYCPLSLSNPMFDQGNLTKKPFSHNEKLRTNISKKVSLKSREKIK